MGMVLAYFYGDPGDPLEKACKHIFEAHHGRYIGAGSWMVGPAKGECDVQYEIADDKEASCRDALKKAGFRLEPTK